MKAILEFDLRDIDDAEDHRIALEGHKWLSVIWELDNELRSDIKYANGDKTSQYWRDKLHELVLERELTLE